MTTLFQDDARIHHATKAKAERLNEMLQAEYPALTLLPVYDGADGLVKVVGFTVYHGAPEDGIVVVETPKVPEIADILEACEDLGIDPEEGAEDDEPAPSSIVKDQYRQAYREASSTQRSCGDWLAEWLAGRTLDANLTFNTEAFHAIVVNNGADMTAPWAKLYMSGQKGWRGRFRMNGRQVLEKLVAMSGVVLDETGAEHTVPAGEIAALREKHAKWIAKEEKRNAAAEEVAKIEA